jgi:predicted ATP-grasp superfamily ATP-dependent carboligase
VRALIVDEGRDRGAVAAARALAAAGWTVGAGSATPSLTSWSRAARAWHRVAHTDEGDEQFLASLAETVRAGAYEVAFVTWERAVALVSAHREELPFPVGYGPHEGVMRAIDKQRLAELAQKCGLSVPRTVTPAEYERAPFAGPVVVKPALQSEVGGVAKVLDEPQAALAHARALERAGGRAIVQERVEGQLLAVSLVAGPQGVVSVAQQRAEKIWPQPVGVTARGRTVPVEPQLLAGVERLLAELRWQGIAQLQFLASADGRRLLIDFNPRFYGSLALAMRAGVNHADVWARLATGRPVHDPGRARPGARYQWFSRDLRASLASPSPAREALACVTVGALAAHSVWSWREPWLGPRFLAAQSARAGRARLRPMPGGGQVRASAALHGVPPTRAVRRALRSRRVPPAPLRMGQRALMKTGRLSYEQAWLGPLQEARGAALGPAARGAPKLLVRVDEFPYYAGLDDAKFGLEASRRFHAVMAEAGVAHLMSVVPQWTHAPLDPAASGGRALDERDLELLAQMRGDGVCFAQHGRTHRTRDARPRRHSELCGLDAPSLAALLDEGRARLEQAGISPRVLVPPFNRFDAGQWECMSERYDVITGGPESVVLLGFHGGPQWRGDAVYLPCYAPLYASAAEVLPAVESLLEREVGTWVPVVLHMGWEIDDDFAALRRLATRIAPYAASWDELLDTIDATRPG